VITLSRWHHVRIALDYISDVLCFRLIVIQLEWKLKSFEHSDLRSLNLIHIFLYRNVPTLNLKKIILEQMFGWGRCNGHGAGDTSTNLTLTLLGRSLWGSGTKIHLGLLVCALVLVVDVCRSRGFTVSYHAFSNGPAYNSWSSWRWVRQQFAAAKHSTHPRLPYTETGYMRLVCLNNSNICPIDRVVDSKAEQSRPCWVFHGQSILKVSMRSPRTHLLFKLFKPSRLNCSSHGLFLKPDTDFVALLGASIY